MRIIFPVCYRFFSFLWKFTTQSESCLWCRWCLLRHPICARKVSGNDCLSKLFITKWNLLILVLFTIAYCFVWLFIYSLCCMLNVLYPSTVRVLRETRIDYFRPTDTYTKADYDLILWCNPPRSCVRLITNKKTHTFLSYSYSSVQYPPPLPMMMMMMTVVVGLD